MIMNYERLLESNFYISMKRYQERKEMFGKRIESVVRFIENDSVCRSRQLIEYFGQPVQDDCGVCDVCIRRRNGAGGEISRNVAYNRIIDCIRQGTESGLSVNMSDIQTIAGDDYKLYIDVLREMADKGIVNMDGERLTL